MTQFQYQDVGVNLGYHATHPPNHDVSFELSVEVSSVTGQQRSAELSQPIISPSETGAGNKAEKTAKPMCWAFNHTNRYEGPQRVARAGHIPLLRYFFSEDTHNTRTMRFLIILTPHIGPTSGMDARQFGGRCIRARSRK